MPDSARQSVLATLPKGFAASWGSKGGKCHAFQAVGRLPGAGRDAARAHARAGRHVRIRFRRRAGRGGCIALEYASENADELGVGSADVGDLFVSSAVPGRASGATHVNLNQRFRGLEVFGGSATISVARDGRVFFASGAFVSDLAGASGEADLSATEAVEAAAEELDLDEPTGLRVLSRSDDEALSLAGGISDEAIPAKLGWQPTEAGLRLAWQVTIDDSEAVDLWNAAVDAETGELLDAANWTSHGSPNPVIDGSSYRVFAFPKGDPNDGPRTIDANPAERSHRRSAGTTRTASSDRSSRGRRGTTSTRTRTATRTTCWTRTVTPTAGRH